MGVGNRYTLQENNQLLAYTLLIDFDDTNDHSDVYQWNLDCLIEHIATLPICAKYGLVPSINGYDNAVYYGDQFIVELSSNYYGDGIVIDFKYQSDFEHEGLLIGNYEKCYHKLIKHINQCFELVQGHGWTHTTYQINTIQ